jgi:alpha-glucosidase
MKDMIVNNMLATGVCVWMCDFGETVPLDARLWSDADPYQYHSLYPEIWAALNREAVREVEALRGNNKGGACDSDDVVFFMRSGSPGSTPLFWLGDQTVTWDSHDGLGTAIIRMLTEGLSGYSLTHSDIGGYTAIDLFPLRYIRTKELLMRWCELAAFTTMYRSHLGTLPSQNWQVYSDTETLRHFFAMAAVFQAWGFYREELMREAEFRLACGPSHDPGAP